MVCGSIYATIWIHMYVATESVIMYYMEPDFCITCILIYIDTTKILNRSLFFVNFAVNNLLDSFFQDL